MRILLSEIRYECSCRMSPMWTRAGGGNVEDFHRVFVARAFRRMFGHFMCRICICTLRFLLLFCCRLKRNYNHFLSGIYTKTKPHTQIAAVRSKSTTALHNCIQTNRTLAPKICIDCILLCSTLWCKSTRWVSWEKILHGLKQGCKHTSLSPARWLSGTGVHRFSTHK